MSQAQLKAAAQGGAGNSRQILAQTATDAGAGNVKKFFESQKGMLKQVLPKHLDPDRMLRIALGAMRTTPKLMNCTVESLLGAAVQCSMLGLEPNTPMGHIYLIPFDKREKVGNEWRTTKTEVQIIMGYKGMLDLARRSGQIISIGAHEVCENDEFDYAYGLDERLHHKPALGNRGEVIAFYAVAKLVGGGHAFEVMSREQVDQIRDKSAEKNRAKRDNRGNLIITGPWADHYVEMGRKTATRRLFKWLPMSIEMANAASLDERAETGASQALDTALQGDYTVLTPSDPEPQEPDGASAQAEQQDDQPATDSASNEQQRAGDDDFSME